MLSFRCTVHQKGCVWCLCLVFCPFHSYSFTEGHEVPTHPLCKTWSGPATGMVPYSGWWWDCGMPWAKSSQGMIVDDKCLWNVAFYSRSRKVVLFLDCFWRTCFLFCLEDDEVTPYAEMPWTYYQLDGNAIYFRWDLLPDMLLKRANASESPKVTVWQSEERVR